MKYSRHRQSKSSGQSKVNTIMAMSNPAEWSLVKDLKELCRSDSLSIDMLREKTAFIPHKTTKAGHIFERISIMHLICANRNVTEEIVEHLRGLDPEAAGIYSNKYMYRFNLHNRNPIYGSMWSYPLHLACMNVDCPSSVIKVLARMHPPALSHISSLGGTGNRIFPGFDECLPLQIYLSRGNIDIDAVKVLAETLPEDLMTKCVHEFVCHEKIGVQLDVVRVLIEQNQLPTHDGLTLLHAVLLNKNGCPSSIILLLAEKYPFALTHQCSQHYNGLAFDDATPLEIYLKSWHHIDFTVAEVLLQPLPEAMIANCLINFLGYGKLEGHLDIVKLLIERAPSLIEATTEEEATLLHEACRNVNVTLEVVQFLAVERNDMARQRDTHNELPLHALCQNHALDDTTSLEIVRFLVACYPGSVRYLSSDKDRLPLHFAASCKTRDFCEKLVHAFPQSVSEVDSSGNLPFHRACECNASFLTAYYFYSLDKKSIEAMNSDGMYPIHLAVKSNDSAEVTQFLLHFHPEEAAHAVNDRRNTLPLHLVSNADNMNSESYERNLSIVKILFDVYPEAILMRNNDSMLPIDLRDRSVYAYNAHMRRFLNRLTDNANNARNIDAMTSIDESGRLPLHNSIWDRAQLGSIKLIVNGNPSAVQAADANGSLPLHFACFRHCVATVNYLVELDSSALGQSDRIGNTPLHYACRAGNFSIIKSLLQKQPQPVYQTNAEKQLPIHLLWGFDRDIDRDIDRESADYVEAVWRLLRACPVTALGRVCTH